MSLLQEITGLVPEKWEKQDSTHFVFEIDGYFYGVLFEDAKIDLRSFPFGNILNFCNVVFGTLKNTVSWNIEDLDLKLTNLGNLRKVLSTVSDIVVNSSSVKNCDIVMLGGADDSADRREKIYLRCYSEIHSKLAKFDNGKVIKFDNGSRGIVGIAVHLKDEDIEAIKTLVDFSK